MYLLCPTPCFGLDSRMCSYGVEAGDLVTEKKRTAAYSQVGEVVKNLPRSREQDLEENMLVLLQKCQSIRSLAVGGRLVVSPHELLMGRFSGAGAD